MIFELFILLFCLINKYKYSFNLCEGSFTYYVITEGEGGGFTCVILTQ